MPTIHTSFGLSVWRTVAAFLLQASYPALIGSPTCKASVLGSAGLHDSYLPAIYDNEAINLGTLLQSHIGS